jgi:prevent-host-death family protein
MATYIPQRELRNNPGAVLARVEAGEELTITVRGRPVADLVPTRGPKRPLTMQEFIDGFQGILAGDDTFREDMGLDGEAEDPFERWGK